MLMKRESHEDNTEPNYELFATAYNLYYRGAYIKRFDVYPNENRITVTVAISRDREFVPGLDGDKVPQGLIVIQFLKTIWGDRFQYQYVVEPELPSFDEVLDMLGLDEFRR